MARNPKIIHIVANDHNINEMLMQQTSMVIDVWSADKKYELALALGNKLRTL